MPVIFAKTTDSQFKPGMFYLGLDDGGKEIGLGTERHAITIAGAGSGKGAALIIPNLLRWPHNALVVDPKGENAERTWKAREAMGQTVRVLDPFEVANVPPRLRSSCNLLSAIDPKGPAAREDMRVIADGLVMRYKTEDATWDNGAVSVLAGFIDFVLNDPQSEGERDLTAVRRLLTLPPDALEKCFKEMAELETATGLARAAASIGLSDSRKNKEFVSGAVDHSEWLDSPAMASILTGNGFNLSELKTGNTTVFLVLPPQYLAEHGRFLRVFVRAALDAMAKGLKGRKCLFLLDEFFSLGSISTIEKAAGLMRGYGVQLWPFLQDLGQLIKLYGKEGAETFFGNADAHIFFGNTDRLTLEYISRSLGNMNQIESSLSQGWTGPRLTPDQVRELIAKKDGDTVARRMLVFGKGSDIYNLMLRTYFAKQEPKPRSYWFWYALALCWIVPYSLHYADRAIRTGPDDILRLPLALILIAIGVFLTWVVIGLVKQWRGEVTA